MDTKPSSFLIFVYLCFASASANFRDYETSLRNDLLSNYTASVRPDNYTQVYISLLPISLNGLNIGEESMSMTAVVVLTWNDPRLAFSSGSYGGITMLSLEPFTIWTPTVMVENAVSNLGIVGGDPGQPVKTLVRSTGLVSWYPAMETTVYCGVRIFRYPFDTQECSIRVTGIGDSITMVDYAFASTTFDTRYYSDNGEWDLLDQWMETSYFDDTNNGVFKRNEFYFRYRRKWQFYSMNLLMPIVLTSILMCAVFALPIESGEKMGFSLTVLLSYVVFLTWVTDNLPAVSTDTSVLQVYLAVVLCLGVIATLLTTWILYIYHQDSSRPMSRALLFFVRNVLAPCFSSQCCRNQCKQKISNTNEKTSHANESSHEKPKPNNKIVPQEDKNSNLKGPLEKWENDEKSEPLFFVLETTEESRDLQRDYTWQEVAVMFDRFFVYLFGTAMTVCTIIILIILFYEY